MNIRTRILCALTLTFIIAFLLSRASALQPETMAIVGATVIDGTGASPRPATVIIRGDRIIEIGAPTPPAGARIIQADGQTLIPGLFDLHTHLPYATAGGVIGDWGKNIKAYLYCGVTTVVDFGTYPETFEPMRRLVRTGVIEGPRLVLAARMTTPGGHGAEGGRGDFFSLEVSSAREARAAVRRVLPFQPNVIKVFTDGWRYGTAPDMTSMNEETLTALVDEAHQNGIEVLTHTVTLERARIAARAGVDVIAHGIGDKEADDDLVRLMKARGTTYASTLAVYEPRGRDILSPLLETVLDPAVRERIEPPLTAPGTREPATSSSLSSAQARARRWQYLMRNVGMLRGAGVAFGAGTDAGVTGTHHGWATLRELELLAQGGLTPIEAINSATGASARALKLDGERGTIVAGKLADLVLIDGRPHENIGDLQRISRVFLGGREIDRARLAREIAAEEMTPIPPITASELIDDFERADGRTRIDTQWVNGTDAGVDSSRMVYGRLLRAPGDHALSAAGRLAVKERPFLTLNLPLSRGAVEPVDASAFNGVSFDARGDGDYSLIVQTRGVRRTGSFHRAPFKAETRWRRVRIKFSDLRQPADSPVVPWTGQDLLLLSFEIARPAGTFGWLELDNIRFERR